MKEKIREQINDVSEGMTNTNGHESTDEQPEGQGRFRGKQTAKMKMMVMGRIRERTMH